MDKNNDKILGRNEAILVAQWLKDRGITLKSGWVTVYKLRPSDIAKKYSVKMDEVVKAARRGE